MLIQWEITWQLHIMRVQEYEKGPILREAEENSMKHESCSQSARIHCALMFSTGYGCFMVI
jgi:hypothetical protein